MRVAKGIYEQGNAFVVRIRRNDLHYSESFPFADSTSDFKKLSAKEKGEKKRRALKAAADWQDKELRSVLVRGVRADQDAEKLTLREVVETYRDEGIPKLKSETQTKWQANNALEVATKEKVDDKPFAHITEKQWVQLRNKYKAEGYEDASVNRLLGIYSSAAKYFREEKRIDLHFPRELFLKVSNRQMVTTDFETFSVIAAKIGNVITRNGIYLHYYTGARRSEITKAKWEYIDWKTGILTLPTSKNDDPRTLFLNKQAVALLKGMKPEAGKGYIFSEDGGQTSYHKDTFTRAWIRARKAVYAETKDEGILTINLHALRHTFITRFASQVDSVLDLKRLSGHKDLRSLQRYDHTQAATVKKKLGTLLNKV